MRLITAAAITCLLAPVAVAQTSRLERELRDAQSARDVLISEADKAMASNDWNLACEKGKAASAMANKMLELSNAYFDAIEEEEDLEEADFDVMARQTSMLIEEARVIGQARDAVCEKASE
jgi:hypothetical protein